MDRDAGPDGVLDVPDEPYPGASRCSACGLVLDAASNPDECGDRADCPVEENAAKIRELLRA